ncbi:hypothetical protein BDZ45DRAFT_631770 [Acephala macrosclerotiorum]|nr:hypothetical protein BDZ45DRAFT_631770 [Acephala macrosclerotiorum]
MNSIHAVTLLRCSQCAIRSTARAGSAQQRLFATSAVLLRHGAVPSFTDVSSPELQGLLTTIREKVFLPAHLSESQTLLIEKEKYRKQLETPTKATIAGEEFTLKPLPKLERPNVRRSLATAVELMKEKRDWDNLPNLLKGLKTAAGLGLTNTWKPVLRKVASRLGNAGRQDVLLECLRRGSETGITLSSRNFATTIITQFHRKAVDSDFNPQETKKAFSWAEQAAVLMENPEHAGNTNLAGEDDPRTSPEVIGILLDLAAVNCSKNLSGKDEDNKVASYAEKFLNTPVALKPVPDVKGRDGYGLNRWLWTGVPILHSLNLAQSILGPKSKYADELRSRAATVGAQVEDCKTRLEQWKRKNRHLYGTELYKKLVETGS